MENVQAGGKVHAGPGDGLRELPQWHVSEPAHWPAQLLKGLLTAARFTGHFVLALATVLFVGADHAEY